MSTQNSSTADHDPSSCVPPDGMFLAAPSADPSDNSAADIYFDDYWTTKGAVYRLVTIKVTWSLTIAFVEKAYAAEPGRPEKWAYCPWALGKIAAQTSGAHSAPDDAQGQPQASAARYGHIIIGNRPVMGIMIPSGQHIVLTRTDGKPFHYHQHFSKTAGEVGFPAIKPGGTHKVFPKLEFGSRIQHSVVGMVDL